MKTQYKNISFYTCKHIPKIQNIKNYTTYLGSSETIRETSFNFIDYKQFKVSHKKTIDKPFLEWFIGFSEGNASFIVSKNRLFFIINSNQKDIKILYSIRKNLGFGKVSTYNGYGRYIVADRENIDRLICIFNGNLLFKKTNNCFQKWLQVRNSYALLKILYKSPTLLPDIDFDKSSWLTGFIDAQAYFSAYRKNDKTSRVGFRVYLRFSFIIDEKNEKPLLEKIQSFFTCGYIEKTKTQPPSDDMYRVVFYGSASILKCIAYLQKYPLKTKKKVCYTRFCSIFNKLQDIKASCNTEKSINRLKRLIEKL